MTQNQAEMVQEVQSYEQLKNFKRKNLLSLVKQFKEEDTDCLQEVNGRSKDIELITALADHLGFTTKDPIPHTPHSDEPVDKTAGLAVFGDDAYLNPALQETDQADVMEFGEGVPTLNVTDPFKEEETDPVVKQIMAEENMSQADAEDMNNEHLKEMTDQADTAQAQVDDFLSQELGLDFSNPPPQVEDAGQQAEGQVQGEPEQAPAEETPKRGGRRATIPMDAPIPIRQYDKLILGIYGNILTERDEPFPEGHKYEGMVHEEIKLERFNSKAHEVFRKTKGHMHLLYTNVGSAYLMVYKKPDGTLDPVLEVTNKGRGHLRCKQIANMLQVAYNEKLDQAVISAEEYQKLAEQIELIPINAESV